VSDSHFQIKQGAQNPALEATLTKGDGSAQDLSGGTVTFSMKRKRTGAVKVNAAPVVIVSAVAGMVKYLWAGVDSDTPGVYYGQFTVTGLSGGPAVFPTSGYIYVTVVPKASS
jgi:hypothetical protein